MNLLEIVHDPDARCLRCGRATDLIEGDGAVVCTSSVRSLGELANDPHNADDRVLAVISERHGDVVMLGKTQSNPSRLKWNWIGWP